MVMDEFHSFSDPERGIVWELSLGLLPPHVRTLLLSATVGNATEFIHWLRHSHQRELELVKGAERKVPLIFHWVPDMLLNEQIEEMAAGDDEARKTPALVFCFNREECWTIAEQLKGKKVLSDGQQARLVERTGAITTGRKGPGRNCGSSCCAAWECTMRACCPSIGGSSRNCFSRSCSPSPCARRRSRRASTCRPARSCCPASSRVRRRRRKLSEPSAAPPDFRPRRPAAVRQAGLRLRAGPRGRRADRPLAREIRPDPRRHQGPRPAAGEERPEAEDAQTPRIGAVLERGPVRETRRPHRPASFTAAARCPGGCWPTCSTPRPRWT